MANNSQPFHPSVLHEQEREMRRLELGEAWHKGDGERVGEITQEMKDDGVRGIGNEHYRAQEAYGEFLDKEEKRAPEIQNDPQASAQRPETPDREAEGDPQRVPEHDPRQQQAQDPQREAPEDPERQQTQDPERQPVLTYDDMKREHAEIVANSPQDQQEPEAKTLRFYGDPNQEQARETERGDRSDDKEIERGDAGQRNLSFFEDRNPAQEHDIER
jgi:hypothetical protein